MRVELLDGNDLTPREAEVLCCVASGLSDKGIARALGISIKTVVAHCGHIYQKMEVDKRQGNVRIRAVGLAIARGLIIITR